jgi:hypothetical protein
MQREGRLDEIELGPLDERSTRQLATAVAAGIDAGPIVAESGGHPFFALELARARARGVQTSDSLEALLADRLDRLEGGAGALVPWAAALGRSFRADVLARVTGLSDAELVTALSELERRAILRADAGGPLPAYDFVHDLVRTAAYRRLSAPRRAVLHRAIARVLEDLAAADGALFGDMAHHAALAGEHDLAVRAAVAASERCIRMLANEEAARIAESGLVHADRLAGETRMRARIALLGVKVLSGLWLRRASELVEDLSAATEEARAAGLRTESLRGLYYLSLLHREHGDLQGAHRSTREAVSLCRDTDDVSRARQLVLGARCFTLIERDVEEVRGMLDEAAALLPDHERDFEWCWAEALERDYRDASDAGVLLEQAYARAHREEQPWSECECLMRLAQRALERGEPLEALAWCKELGPVAAKLTDGSEGVVAEALEALGIVASGEPGADDRLAQALARLREFDAKGMLAYVLVSVAEIDRRAGRVERAQAHAEEALALARLVDRRTLVAWARASLAELAIDRADASAARRHLDAIAGDLERPLGISGRARARVERATARIA